MKKLIKKIDEFLELPATNIVVGIGCILVSIVYVLEEFHFSSFFGGTALGYGFGLLLIGIDDFFEKKKKSADQEKTGH